MFRILLRNAFRQTLMPIKQERFGRVKVWVWHTIVQVLYIIKFMKPGSIFFKERFSSSPKGLTQRRFGATLPPLNLQRQRPKMLFA